jgi:hypothetical protein
MKMKKLLSALLSAALLTAGILPASAAAEVASTAPSEPVPTAEAEDGIMAISETAPTPATDERLAKVTAKVKSTLGISDTYGEFYGELQENGLAPVWSLNWSGRDSDGRLEVEATEDGKVIRYYLSSEDPAAPVSSTDWKFPPAFPKLSREQARASAEKFLKKVLEGALETARFSDQNTGRMTTETYRFGGTILLNGLPSPLSFSVTVRAADGVVTRFSRDVLEGQTIGGVPSAKPAASKADAGALLRGTLALRLEYVLDPESKEAVLRYLPESGDEYCVDAQTGELVNLTKLYEEVRDKGESGGALFNAAVSTPEAATDTAAGGLTQAELTGISKLEGVRSKEALDKALRELEALGLDRYTLASANYSLEKESGDVTARLNYTRRGEKDSVWRRTVTCDAKTGDLLEVYSSAPYTEGRKASVSEEEARKTGEAFLTGLWGEEFASSALYASTPWDGERWSSSHGFRYAQKENGYFFPENSLQVAIDITDGSISALSRSWTEDVTFDSAGGILSEDAALDAWFDHFDLPMGYLQIPVALDPDVPEAMPLMDMGYAYFYGLKLAYGLEEDQRASGVDAKTGEIVLQDTGAAAAGITYSDLDGHWAKSQLERMAQYGVGWSGGACRPDSALTQIDLVALILSAGGYAWNSEDDADWLYRRAYDLGLLTRDQRREDKVLTRGEAVKMLLDAAGCAGVAKLPGIFTCAFADKDSIPQDLMGYAALAQGMKLVTSETFDAAGTATRAQAAVMLYNLMARSERGV